MIRQLNPARRSAKARPMAPKPRIPIVLPMVARATFFSPLARFDAFLIQLQLAADRQDQCQSHFGDARRVRPGCPSHGDMTPGRGSEINLVIANAKTHKQLAPLTHFAEDFLIVRLNVDNAGVSLSQIVDDAFPVKGHLQGPYVFHSQPGGVLRSAPVQVNENIR